MMHKEDAVSPVIGVMLMLVVTIIIAALVSSFAGGLGSSTETTPTVTFTVDFSRANGLVLTSTGSSSVLSTNDFVVTASKVGGSDEFYEIPWKYFNTKPAEFTAGNIAYINITQLQTAIDEMGDNSMKGGYITAPEVYQITGKTFTVQLVSDKGVVGTSTSIIRP